MRNSRGRSTTGEAAVPYYLSTPAKEAAKHLRLTVTRYLADRASLADVTEAHAMFIAAQPVKGERGYRGDEGRIVREVRESIGDVPGVKLRNR